MKKVRIALVLLLGIMLVSGSACGSGEWRLLTYTEGEGTISPSTGTFPDGEIVTLTALPESGWDFDHWGGQASGSVNPITITMDSDKTVSAYFVEKQNVVLFSDDFNDPSSGWFTFSDQWGAASYKNGWFHVKDALRDDEFVGSHAGQYFTDLVLEVDTKLIDGSTDNWHIISCRSNQVDTWYSFGISADGYYGVSKTLDGRQTYLMDPTYSTNIRKGKGIINLVHIECIGSTLTLTVNGHLLAEVTDYSLTGGDIELGANVLSYTPSFTEVAYDNLVVTAP